MNSITLSGSMLTIHLEGSREFISIALQEAHEPFDAATVSRVMARMEAHPQILGAFKSLLARWAVGMAHEIEVETKTEE